MNWFGVMPAVTTPFDKDLKVDHEFLARHTAWLLENGCTGLIMLGSLGEGATLEHDEKVAILKTAVKASKAKRHAGRRSDLIAFDAQCRAVGEGRRAGGLQRADGSAAVCL